MTEETFTEKIRIVTLFLIGMIVGYIAIKYAFDIYVTYYKVRHITNKLYDCIVYIEKKDKENVN